MPGKRKDTPAWPFARKFSLWLTDNGWTLNRFAMRHGFAQSTLQAWVKQGVRIPSEAIGRIAAATRLPADYWLRADVPYPPPAEYAGAAEEIEQAIRALPLEVVQELRSLFRDPDDLKRTLALRRAARQ